MSKDIRNIAIIAHVDHGKTTLVDVLLQQSGAFRDNQAIVERAMDSNDLERERGITILAKCTSLLWNDCRINIVDTPGHADFGGEVERTLGMVEGVLVLVDAAEGPMPQTKFVLEKALKLGLRPIVVLNKSDRPDARIDAVHSEVFDLFASLDADEEQLDFPTLLASAKEGWAVHDIADEKKDLSPLLDLIVQRTEAPQVDKDGEFKMLASMMEYDPYLGRVLIGKITSGKVSVNDHVKGMDCDGKLVEQGRLTKLLAFRHLSREPIESAEAGDIIAIAGLQKATVANTICSKEVTEPLFAQPIDPPILSMVFSVNDSPLAGRDGSKVTSRIIHDRLMHEQEGNVAIKVEVSQNGDAFEVSGRGELQLAVLIETMRREGFELSVSRPQVLCKKDPETGKMLEPIEEVQIDVDQEFSGVVLEKIGLRRGEMTDMQTIKGGKVRLSFLVQSREMIGYHGKFLSDTRGTGVMNRLFHGYQEVKGSTNERRNGALISTGDGDVSAYALWNLEDRGEFFIEPGTAVYQGMVIGEHSKQSDLEVNPLKSKQLTNMRASGKDDAVRLTPPKKLSLEQAITYIDDDELVEVTPNHIRLRKKFLDPHQRKRARNSQ